MEIIINAWLSIWLYVLVGIASYLAYLIWKNHKLWDRFTVLCTFAIIVLVLHVIEEWVLPGGLHYSYNLSHGSDLLSTYPMNRLSDMITNFGAVVLGTVVLKIWGFRKPAGIAIMLFSLFELIIHVIIGINDMNLFAEYGMQTLYSPGLVTSVFGFLPVAVGLFKELYLKKDEKKPTIVQHIMAVAATVLLCFLLINLPEMLIGTKDNPYKFTDRGYYEQFAEEFEADNEFEY